MLRLGMLTPSSNTVLEPVTYAMLRDQPSVTAHFARFKVTEIALNPSALGQFDLTPVDTGHVQEVVYKTRKLRRLAAHYIHHTRYMSRIGRGFKYFDARQQCGERISQFVTQHGKKLVFPALLLE